VFDCVIQVRGTHIEAREPVKPHDYATNKAHVFTHTFTIYDM